MLRPRDEGSGGRDGIVLNMTMSGDGIWDAVYSVQAHVGKSLQPLMLSVDTGSSDIWLAATTCSSCSSAHTSLYDPSASLQTNENFNLTYLRGAVSGPIVWDSFKLGSYSIPSQALAAADQVSGEALSSGFVGLLGLALPPNSEIAHVIPPTESDAPDGATVQQNLFGLTPPDAAPEQRFFSVSLERPGSSRIPSLLGIGRHPANLIPGFDPSNIPYADLIPSKDGDMFWRVPVTAIDAWVDGTQKPIHLDKSVAVSTVAFPVALVDTGGPSILINDNIANGIYGAWNIGPGSDGNYYVPCTTPLNISITLMGFPPIPLHPLDITSPPRASKSSPAADPSICIGQIQAVSSDVLSSYADIVLGVPFLRNVYTVLSSSSSDNASSSNRQGSALPRLGLFPLTDPTTAMSEFHAVRVLGLPLEPSASSTSSPNGLTVGHTLSVGLTVLLAIVGFFVACAALFGFRWWVLRRRFRRMEQDQHDRGWRTRKRRNAEPDEDALRMKRWEAGKKKGVFYAESSTGSDWSHAERRKKGEDMCSDSCESLSTCSVLDIGPHHGEANGVGEPEPDGWGTELHAIHVRTASEVRAGGAAATTPLLEDAAAMPLLDEGEHSPSSPEADVPPAHDRVPSTSSASGPFADEFEMTAVGARASTLRGSRPSAKPRGARPRSGGSFSTVSSRTWRAEVGHMLQQVDLRWPTEPARG